MHDQTHTHPLVHTPHTVLSTPAKDVGDITSEEMRTLIEEMYATMYKEKGIGLAAPQIGVNLRLAVIDVDAKKFVIANPDIITKSQERVVFPEGCLSIPGKEFPIIRHEKIIVKYLDEHGKQCKIKLKGFLAVVFQHEIDHLNGYVIADRHGEQQGLRKEFGIQG